MVKKRENRGGNKIMKKIIFPRKGRGSFLMMNDELLVAPKSNVGFEE